MTDYFVDIGGALINRLHIVSADIDTQFYVNGSVSTLVVKTVDGREIRREHGFGFDAFETLKKIKGDV